MTVYDTPVPIKLRQPGSGRVIVRSMSYLRPYLWHVVGTYLLLLLSNGISMAMPLIIRAIVDEGIRGGDRDVIQLGAASLMGITLVRAVFTFLSGRWTEVASQGMAYDLRNTIHDKLQSLSFSYHDKATTGQLLTRAVGDVDRMRFLGGRALLQLTSLITLIIGIAVSMLIMNLRLALVTLIIVPFLAYGALIFGTRFRPIFRTMRRQMDALTTHLEQNLRGARIIAAFAQEQSEIRQFDDENARLLELRMMAARMRSLYLPLLQLIGSAGIILILLYGGQLVIRGQLTIGELVAFSAYVSQLLMPVRRLGWVFAAIAQSIASAERVFEILDAKSEVEDVSGAQPLGPVKGHVTFDDVSFSYFGRDQVLTSVSLEARPGEVVALLGATGSGKSSIINLIPRFYDPTDGRVLLDGRDIRLATQRFTDLLSGAVRQQPDHWFWPHRRWKTVPVPGREERP